MATTSSSDALELALLRQQAVNSMVAEPPVQPYSPSIDELVRRFLRNVKFRFGSGSFEDNAIKDVLYIFHLAKIPKRKALSSILRILGNQHDLKLDLLNVLTHEEAKWSTEDFDFNGIASQACPRFLQPGYELQTRTSSMAAPWYSDAQHDSSADPALRGSHSGLNNFRNEDFLASDPTYNSNTNWPSSTQDPSYTMRKSSPALPSLHRSTPLHMALLNAPFDPYHPRDVPQKTPHRQDRHQESWDRTSLGGFWSVTEPNTAPTQAHYSARNQVHNSVPSPLAFQNRPPTPGKDFSYGLSPSVMGLPLAMPIGQPVKTMPPPPLPARLYHRGSSDCYSDQAIVGGERGMGQSPTSSAEFYTGQRYTGPSRGNPYNAKVNQSRTEQRAFVHGLCGKKFATRSKVKKHHWGVKNNDLNTKTGCWAKHKKPNVDWDDHPSCKVDGPVQRAAKRTDPLSAVEQNQSDFLFPSRTMVGSSSSQRDVEDVPSHHFQSLLDQGHTESPLTAVKTASKIEAPKPQGRNDSMVSHLDAQAMAAELNELYFP